MCHLLTQLPFTVEKEHHIDPMVIYCVVLHNLVQTKFVIIQTFYQTDILPSSIKYESYCKTYFLLKNALTWRIIKSQLLRKARPEEFKAVLELCLNMKEGNLTMPKKNPHRTIVTALANRNISLSNKKKWLLEYYKMLSDIKSPALKEWKR